jgi:hypothetical protein
VWAKLPGLENREEVFGPQFVVDASGDWLRTEPRLLSTSADISIEAATVRVHDLGGAAIPCHVDRPSFSLLANLGFISVGLEADALEVTVQFRPEKNPSLWEKLEGRPLVVSGDAHRLQDVQARTTLTVEEAVIPEILQAFRGENGRSLRVNWS